MKWLVIVAVICGLYAWSQISMFNMAMGQVMQFQKQYQLVADKADQIAADGR